MRAEPILEKLGITRTYYGYWILSDIINTAVDDEEILLEMGGLYEAEAIRYSKNPCAIEKAARTAISKAWKTNKPLLKQMARYDLLNAPSISEFCDIIVSYLLRQRKHLEAHNNQD